MVNILIASCGTRNKIVQYFRKALEGRGRVIATDCSPHAPALYEADTHYIVPRITEKGYMDTIYDICRKEKVQGILSLIDPELSLLALHEKELAALDVTVIGSSYELCERTLDKWEMFQWLSAHGYLCARSYREEEAFFEDVRKGLIAYPVFVKPVRGSASLAIAKADDEETVRFLMKHGDNMMIQEFLDGQEIGADCYIDLLSAETVSVFTKKKLVMRAGETDKAISFYDARLTALIKRFIRESGFRGQIDIDIFEIDGQYYISEVNPRFGGGYPHAYACGADHMKLIVHNLEGQVNEAVACDYKTDVVMMKYNEIMIRQAENEEHDNKDEKSTGGH